METFAVWLESTAASQYLIENALVVPVVQTIHIIAIAVLCGSLLMVLSALCLGPWRRFAPDLVAHHFSAWFVLALGVLLCSGTLMIVAEPVRSITTYTFWIKMAFVAGLVTLFTRILVQARKEPVTISGTPAPAARFDRKPQAIHALGLAVTILFVLAIIAGRWIAYDY